MIPSLGWLDAIPASPVRLKKIRNHASVDAKFLGMPFATYIVVENLYQGFLSTQKDALLDKIAAVGVLCADDEPVRTAAPLGIYVACWEHSGH